MAGLLNFIYINFRGLIDSKKIRAGAGVWPNVDFQRKQRLSQWISASFLRCARHLVKTFRRKRGTILGRMLIFKRERLRKSFSEK